MFTHARSLLLTLLLGACSGLMAEDSYKYSWQDPHAKVLPNGGLEWAPKPFVFEKGKSVRYIDFDGGDDTKDGATQQTAWKHHPWDAAAAGEAKACKGIQTYVFKGGVIYRGKLNAVESGAPGDPIRLTSDPSWGKGEALFYGSTQIKGGWKQASADEAPGIPDTKNVWYIDLGKDYDPDPEFAKFSALWQVNGEKAERLILARTPNYDLSDPNNPVKNWFVWNNYNDKTETLTSAALKGLGDKTLLNGAVIWSETDFLMGAAISHPLGKPEYDPATGAVTNKGSFGSHWFKRIPNAKVHFMIERVAKFLDAPGEFFFSTSGPKAGRLFLWPFNNEDPNKVSFEVAQTRMPLVIADQHDLVISGIEFRYNDPDDGTPPDYRAGNGSPSPCIRLTGNCSNITIKNCKFYFVANAIVSTMRPDNDYRPQAKEMDNIIVSDNDVAHSERGGTILIAGDSQGTKGEPYGQLKHVEVLRNRVVDTGFRCGYSPWSSIPAISVSIAETCEVAGNIVDTSFGNGIITYGGKDSGAVNYVPLTRMFVHHNQIDNTMLGCNDYGGLEHFQGGPVYLYNNITRNCVGNRTLGGELGYSLYLDGGFKCYCFNNIIAGLVKEGQPDYYNNCGYFMVFGFMDQLFNNTIYHVTNGLDGSSGNRSNIVGNLMADCKSSFISQNRAGDVSMMGGGDTGEMGRTGIPTMVYANNVFFGEPAMFGRVAGTSANGGKAPVVPGKTLEELRTKLEAEKCRLGTLGWQVKESPLVDPAKKDYRLTENSGAKERGVKYFTPWSLARTVGEWNFFKSGSNPQTVLGEGFYMTDEYIDRGMYYFIPRNDLVVSSCAADDYIAGNLEDWIEGALKFDGKRSASLAHAELIKNMEYPGNKKNPKIAYDGSKRETLDMGANNFLIETVFKTDAGHSGGVLCSKLGQAGYELSVGADGGASLLVISPNGKATAASPVKINDGKWHHLIVEVHRAAGKVAFYVDGKEAGKAGLDALSKEAALSNTADFVVGKGLVGAVDFLRVCRSTLAESKTTIDELYTWEFDGPFLRDFTGKLPAGKRDAGALLR